MKQSLLYIFAAAIGALVPLETSMAQSYQLIDIKPLKLERAELTWMVDVKQAAQPWKLRYQKGNNDIVMSFQHPTWNSKTKLVEIGLAIGPVNEGQVRFDLVDMRSMTLIGQISASTSAGTLGLKTIKLTPRRHHDSSDPETFTLSIIFDDGQGCRMPIVNYVFKRAANP